MTAPTVSVVDEVLAELTCLDLVLRERVRRFRATAAPGPAETAAYYIPDAEIDALLETPLAGTAGHAVVLHDIRAGTARLDRLARTFGLTPVDVDVVIGCLAPEVDRRYERLYGYLQDDVTRRSPTVGLLLGLACPDLAATIAARGRFAAGAPLLRHRLVELDADPGRVSLLDRAVRLEPRVTRHLLGDDTVDDDLRGFVTVIRPDSPAEPPGERPVVHHRGPDAGDRQAAVEALGLVTLAIRTDLLAARPAAEFARLLGPIDRECRLQDAIPYWADTDVLLAPGREEHHRLLLDLIRERHSPVLLGGAAAWEADDDGPPVVQVDVPVPDRAARERLWRAAVGPAPDVGRVAATFAIGRGRIRAAAATTLARGGVPTEDDLFAACREHSHQRLGGLAERISPRHGWDDLVLPDDRISQLRDLADQVRHRERVHDDWGFGRTAGAGRGLNVLFAGPSGTGKTMAADVLAGALGLDLYKVDLSTMVSKYIGETEKNLARVFDEVATGPAILFFDEADALFGKRTQVRDAHDRYANLETSYLLQKLEAHGGVVVLATNLRKNMDEAFVRRLQVTVDFPVPDPAGRRRIWQRIWPAAAPLATDVDLDRLAREVDLPGGNIRTIALAAAFLAAADGGVITAAHLDLAVRREHLKTGRVTGREVAADRHVPTDGDVPADAAADGRRAPRG